MELLIAAAVVIALIYGLQHNAHRTPHPHLAGSTDIQDRDQDRLTKDLNTHQ